MNVTQSKAKRKLLESLEQENRDYKQWLYKIVEPKDKDLFKELNKKKAFEYGYNEELDIVVISHTGKVGEIYEMQGLRIGVPTPPKDVPSRSEEPMEQYWEHIEVPDFIDKIKTFYQFQSEVSETVKEQWSPYINEEFDRREKGYWFMNKGVPTYIVGSHYMYLQWTRTDVGNPEFRDSNRLFFYFWEACKADRRSYGMCYLKNRRSGFSFMASAESVNLATITKESKYGILSKSGADAKEMFVNKVVPMVSNYPFFFKPIQDGMEKPKTELSFKKPSRKITHKSLKMFKDDDGLGEGLNSIIDWKNTGDYSYDGQKLKLLVHDESGKWEKPDNIQKNWRVTKTCLRLGARLVGKCMMGSTAGALDSGGEEFKDIYEKSDLRYVKRNDNGQTSTGLYSLFIPMEWNVEGYIDKFGHPVFNEPYEGAETPQGDPIRKGVIEYWRAEVAGLKGSPDDLNAYYRQYPMSEAHAFRDESGESLFNIAKIYDQIDTNDDLHRDGVVTVGNFAWEGGVMDSRVVFHPNNNGRFHITKVLPFNLQNNVVIKKGLKYPGNEHIGAFGCDPYDISGTVGGGASNGALHGLSKYHMEDFPVNHFFCEYISRPPTAEIFFEDVLMACIFYGMPLLAENNKPGLLKYFARRGYRGFSITRFDKKMHKLSVSEREIGGIPMSGDQIKHDHANAINSYIEEHVGEGGTMYFNRTLMDWLHFDINNRTKHDASISSGLAVMANQKMIYRPTVKRDRETKVQINLGQRGPNNKLIFGNDR